MERATNNHITFVTLTGSQRVGIYDPKHTTLQRVRDEFFKHYRCEIDPQYIRFYSTQKGKFLCDLPHDSLMCDLGFGDTTLKLSHDSKRQYADEKRKSEQEQLELESRLEEIRATEKNSRIIVATIGSLTLKLEVDCCFTISDIKKMIYDSKRIMPNQQRLIFAGKSLEDDRTLADYNIQKDSTIQLVLQLRGGMYVESSGRDGEYGALHDALFVIDPDVVNEPKPQNDEMPKGDDPNLQNDNEVQDENDEE